MTGKVLVLEHGEAGIEETKQQGLSFAILGLIGPPEILCNFKTYAFCQA